MMINGVKVSAVVDTGAWPSVLTQRMAKKLNIDRTGEQIRLKGLGRETGWRSVPAVLVVNDDKILVEFSIVKEFPYGVCLGLRDLLRLPSVRPVLLKLFEKHNFSWQDASFCGAVDVASGVDENLSDEELTTIGRKTLRATADASMSEEDFDKIWSVFLRHKGCWLRPRSGKYTGPPASVIPIGQPYKGQRRLLSPVLKEEVDRQIESQLKAGVIEPSKSAWASPIHMVQKKGGDWRMVVDYREVNKRIKSDTYPLPLIHEILQEASHFKYYIKLDLNWGFWNMPLEEDAKIVTAFVTHKGLFQFRVVPFGLKNSPSEFQRCTDSVFGHLYKRNCRVYIDDIVLFANSMCELLETLELVLAAAEDGGLYLKLQKSNISAKEIPLLGCRVGGYGYRADPARVEALQKAAAPSNKKELRSFLGTVNYLRDFVPNFSETTVPLRRLLKKGASWEWTSDLQSEFEWLLSNLSASVLLSAPRGKAPFVVLVDASDYAIGGCLMQLQEERLVILSFFSKSLSDAEKKWDTREKEAYALKWSLEKNKDLLRGHQVLIFTDHSSLQWAKDAPQSKIQRWMWYILQFDVSIYHIRGEQNLIADWVSRCNVYSNDHDDVINEVAVPLLAVLPLSGRVELPTVTQLENAIKEVDDKEKSRCVVGADGLLYSRAMKLFIPHQFRNNMTYWFHAGPSGIHRGINATLRQMRGYVWWPKLAESVRSFVQGCLLCSRNRSPKRSTSTMVLKRPTAFELVSLDFVGPREVDCINWQYIVTIDHCTRFIETQAVREKSSAVAIEILRDRWIPVFGAPKVVLCDNDSVFTSNEFTKFITEDVKAHLVHSSPYYPEGNSINESSHRVLEHGIKCFLQCPHVETFPEVLRKVTAGYNASYLSSIGDSPFALTFGKPPILPGWQSLSVDEPEHRRRALIAHGEAQRELEAFLTKPSETTPLSGGGAGQVKVGDFVIFPYGDYEKHQADIESTTSSKYTADWSFPSKVLKGGSKQLQVVEYGTGRLRKVAVAQCRKLPMSIPRGLKELNWEHIHHRLPKRWVLPLRNLDLPSAYSDLQSGQEVTQIATSDLNLQSLPSVSGPCSSKKRRIVTKQEEE